MNEMTFQTQDSIFEPWRSEAEHATSRSRRLPTILSFTRGWGRNVFVSSKPPRPGTEPRTLTWKAAVLTTTLGPPPQEWKICCSTFHWQVLRGCWPAPAMVVEGIGLHVEDILVSSVISIIISWTFRILAHEENQYSYVYKTLGQFFV